MPDVDVVYYRVLRTFAPAYIQLCEGVYSDEYVSKVIAKALCRLLGKHCNPSVAMMLARIEHVTNLLESGYSLDATKEGYTIDQLAREMQGHPRYTAIAVDAYKAWLMQIENGIDYKMTENSAIFGFLDRVLGAEFFGRMPMIKDQKDISLADLRDRVQQIKPFVLSELRQIAEQILRNGRCDRLRVARLQVPEDSDISEIDISEVRDAEIEVNS